MAGHRLHSPCNPANMHTYMQIVVVPQHASCPYLREGASTYAQNPSGSLPTREFSSSLVLPLQPALCSSLTAVMVYPWVTMHACVI